MKPEKRRKSNDAFDEAAQETARSPRRGRKRIFAWIAAALCVCVAVAVVVPLFRQERSTPLSASGGTARALAEPVYPEMPQFPDYADYENDYDVYSEAYHTWRQGLRAQHDQPADFAAGVRDFCQRSAAELLIGADGENRVYSPVNVYMALAMLAEVADGSSRAQILSLLGANDIEALRTQTAHLWNASYCDDGLVTSVLANSLWLAEGVDYVQETAERLASDYYAASFRGVMGSAEYNAMLQDWINEQTGGLLKEQASDLEMSPDTVLALASTVYFKAGWRDTFSETRTAPDVFYTPDGAVNVDFMHKTETSGTLYGGEGFTAVREELEGDCHMWLILPEEGTEITQLLQGGAALSMTQSRNLQPWEQKSSVTVELSVPKFDVSSELDLKDGLMALGVTDVFDAGVSDFTPLTTEFQGICVDKAEHAARVMVDEEGCAAAAYTVLIMEATSAVVEQETVFFTLDRPFLFVITGSAQQPLFIGIVNQP